MNRVYMLNELLNVLTIINILSAICAIQIWKGANNKNAPYRAWEICQQAIISEWIVYICVNFELSVMNN